MTVVNEHGRPWEHLDYVVQNQNQKQPCEGSFSVTSETGKPLYGRVVPGVDSKVFYIKGWK